MNRETQSHHKTSAERFLTLSKVGIELMHEMDEEKLFHLIAQTACDLMGADFTAFSLRPLDEEGQPLVAARGSLFKLVALVGIDDAHGVLLRHQPLGSAGLLAPIFNQGVPVLVSDTLTYQTDTSFTQHSEVTGTQESVTQEEDAAFAQDQLATPSIPSLGMPQGHPLVRSFLGAPILDREGDVRGALLLGHAQPGRFTEEDQTILVYLATQASVALENARLYRLSQSWATELQFMFDSIADGVILVDHQGHIHRENIVAQHVRRLVHRSPHSETLLENLFTAPVQAVLAGKQVPEKVVKVIDDTGEQRDYLVIAQPLRNSSNLSELLIHRASPTSSKDEQVLSGAVVIWRDVTERRVRLAAQLAQERTNFLEAIFEAMVDGVFVYDQQGGIVQTNTAARALMASTEPPDAEKLPIEKRLTGFKVTDSEGRHLIYEQLPVIRNLRGERFTPDHAVELEMQKREGGMMYASATGGPIYNADGQIIGAVGILRDVTERRRLEAIEREAHAASERGFALLRLILDQLPSCIYLVRGPEARLVIANHAAATLFGAAWEPGQPLHEFLVQHSIRFFRPDGRPLEPDQYPSIRVIQLGETIRQQQIVVRHGDDSSIPVLVNAVPLEATQLPKDPKLEIEGAIESERAALVVFQDVTALMEAEALKDEFLSIATHELRTPLAVLKGYSDMLLRQAARGRGAPLTAWQQEGLQGITQATTRLSDLTADLLDVTRLQAEQQGQPSDPTDLVALASRVIKRQQVTTHRHRLILHTSFEHLVANIDTGRMEQVLTNLLNNAIKYSPQGGDIEIVLRVDEVTEEAVFSIQDHGIGIPLEQQAKIFGRFVRADNAHASEIMGTGLGLYLCRELVERYGGRIWFESIEGAGSTFFVALPVFTDESGFLQESSFESSL